MRDSTSIQKGILENTMGIARNLQIRERDFILHVIEGAHVPPTFRYLLRDDRGTLLVANRPEEFICAIFEIVKEALAYGVPVIRHSDAQFPARYSEAEVESYMAHKPRELSLDFIEHLTRNVPDRFFYLAASSLVEAARTYFLEAKKAWPQDWFKTEFTDMVAMRGPLPATDDQRFSLIRRLMEARLSRIPNALAAMELTGSKIRDMDDGTLLSSMDASILALTEQFFQATENVGVDGKTAIQGLHRMRVDAHLRAYGLELPQFDGPFTLDQYAKFYLHIAHSHGVIIDFRAIDIAIRMICAFYSRASEKCFSETVAHISRN